jgi:ATP-dependent helicase Lhr and Lhr-like helicase
LPEAIGLLREVRRNASATADVALSAADPLNLLGILTPGARLPALTANRILYREGLPLATLCAGEMQLLASLEPQEQWAVQQRLQRRHVPAPLADLT